jgi:beta-1,2-mannobiose phosphorylase / 1,2-beta-oligomannan phosphorylase
LFREIKNYWRFVVRKSFYFGLFLVLFLPGCRETPVEPVSKNETGSILLKIDRENAPASVVTVNAKLERNGFVPIIAQMNLLTDSTADLGMNAIPIGQWHLLVEAKNQAGEVEYKGEANVTIIQNTIVQVTLTLYPISGSTGGIYILVSWGETFWKDSPSNPVLKTSQNPSSPTYVTQSKVIYDNGIYKMWYNALYNNAVASIWYAESPDGKTWNTIGNQPVLTKGGTGSWDQYSVGIINIFKENNVYKMYYLGYDAHPYQTSWKLGLATSTDGKNWQKHPSPILNEEGKYYRFGMTSIVKHNNTYYGYFGYFNSTFTKAYIGAATSSDGINWAYYSGNPILSPSFDWEGNRIFYPAVIYDEGKFKMYYDNSQQNSFGYAEAVTPFNFIKNTQPAFKSNQSIHNWAYTCYPNYLKVNNEHRIYYSGFDGSSQQGICYIYK